MSVVLPTPPLVAAADITGADIIFPCIIKEQRQREEAIQDTKNMLKSS